MRLPRLQFSKLIANCSLFQSAFDFLEREFKFFEKMRINSIENIYKMHALDISKCSKSC